MKHLQALYLHGFASSPTRGKAEFFADVLESLQVPVNRPDLNGDFTTLTIRRILGQIEEEHGVMAQDRPIVIIGSSLGGYCAALHVARAHPVDALILLAPAFNFAENWRTASTEEELEEWRSLGFHDFEHFGYGKTMPLHYEFLEDARTHDPWPNVGKTPTLILHGTQDETVVVETSYEYVKRYPEVRLETLETDHGMLDALPQIWERTRTFLAKNRLL